MASMHLPLESRPSEETGNNPPPPTSTDSNSCSQSKNLEQIQDACDAFVVAGEDMAVTYDGASKIAESLVLIQRKDAAVDIRFNGICFSVSQDKGKGMKTILHSVSGEFRSGQLTAIMGPSGAGKSTTMNILAGFTRKNVTGEILINGELRDLKKFRKMSCYIMQKDELCATLSVMELMNLAANLKLGSQMTPQEKQLLIDEILGTIGLGDVGGTRSCSLSGGQKKRLAIALELIDNPPVMFFDEPTSGLDSASCYQCISLLKSLARGGRNIICVIHQPSSSIFEMFDQLYLVAGGKCIYRGPTTNVADFISNAIDVPFPSYHSPADYAIDVASGIYGDQIEKLAEAVMNCGFRAYSATDSTSGGGLLLSPGYKDTNTLELSVENLQAKLGDENKNSDKSSLDRKIGASYWSQFALLTRKTVICILRDRTLTFVRLMLHVFIGLLVGLTFSHVGNDASKIYNNAGLIIFTEVFLVATAMMMTVITFPLEMPILIREQMNNWYSIKAYFLAKTIADIPFQIVFTIIFMIPVYFISNQPHEITRFFMCLAIGIMTSLVAQSIGLAVGAILPLQAAVFLSPVSAVPLLLFAGFLVTYSTMPSYLRWLSYLSYMRYGFEGFMVAIYGYDRPNLYCPEEVAYCHFKTPSKFLKLMDMEYSDFFITIGSLVAYYFIIRITAYILLRWRLKSQI